MLAIAGGKGGVGRTTTALGLAAALAGQRRRPLVVDADCGMPTLHRLADAPRAGGLAAVAEGVPPSDAAAESRRFPGVDVLAATPGADRRRALAALPRDRPVVVDCPAGCGRAATLPLRLADRAIVVTTPTRAGVRGAAKMTAIARAVGTPVPGAVVVGAASPPAVVAGRLDVPVPAAVPPVAGPPLDDGDVAAAFDRLAAAVTDLREPPGGTGGRSRRSTGRARRTDGDPRQTAGLHGGNP